jgi:tRNA(fMet)-specific endonuclease VapC
MRYLLDTDICIYTMKRHPPEVRARLSALPVGDVGISGIVLAELRYGICKSERRQANEAALRDFLAFCKVLDWPQGAASEYGLIRAELECQGRIIGSNDLLIAAHALHLGVALVTNNTDELKRVSGLKIENWIDGGALAESTQIK